MRIKKTFQGNLPENTVVNTQSNSQTNAYSCKYADNEYKPKVLYSGQSATGVTLNDNINNYTFVEVIGIRGEGQQVSSKAAVYSGGTTRLCLVDCYYGYGTSMWIDQLGIAISGTSLTIDQYSSCYGSGTTQTVTHDQNIKIYRVLGYK